MDGVSNNRFLNVAGIRKLSKEEQATLLSEVITLYEREHCQEAVPHLTKLARAGNIDAQLQLGLAYETGRGVDKNFERALHWYSEAQRQGCVKALDCIGNLYFLGGPGVIKDDREAMKYFKWGADNLYADAYAHMGQIYLDRGDYGDALAVLIKGAGEKSAKACLVLAAIFSTGKGCLKQDDHRAFIWYTKARELSATHSLEGKVLSDEIEALEVKLANQGRKKEHDYFYDSISVEYLIYPSPLKIT